MIFRRTTVMMIAASLGSGVLLGCSKPESAQSAAPQAQKPLAERIQDIQNNPNMPDGQKQALIAAQMRQEGQKATQRGGVPGQ